MALLQNRADDFIEACEEADNRCFIGIYTLYQVAYANKLILDDNAWSAGYWPEIEKLRADNKRILDYMASLIPIPSDFEEQFRKLISRFAPYSEEDDIEVMIGASLDELIKLGFREIDCSLYEAGMKFNFGDVSLLLEAGAKPSAYLSPDCGPDDVDSALKSDEEVYCLNDEILTKFSDNIDIDGIAACWDAGIKGEKIKLSPQLIPAIYQAAGFQILMKMIRDNFERNSEELPF
ncbi:MAG: hypothetical protein K2N88_07650 [Muribaculaceae bacterium]|nr:hypothetical protein [Muribaculaceae bacterium]